MGRILNNNGGMIMIVIFALIIALINAVLVAKINLWYGNKLCAKIDEIINN